MKVGDYVRTDNGCICKVLKYTDISDNDFYVNTDSPYNVIYKSWIVKSSPNIIDLIEVGDYVNGRIVDEFIYLDKLGLIGLSELEKEDEKFIKSIVTKEMFEAIKYEVSNNER